MHASWGAVEISKTMGALVIRIKCCVGGDITTSEWLVLEIIQALRIAG
jgi:hypothetical protein